MSKPDALAVGALLALDLLAYGQLLDPGRMLADYDALVYFYPLRAYASEAVASGRLPLWNSSSFLGVPFLANPQTALFYPGTWLFFWLPVPLAYGVNLVLHVGLAGLSLYAYLRSTLSVGSAAALVGGLALMLGGVLSGQYGHLNQISAVAWTPLVLLAGGRAASKGSLRWLVAAAGIVGLQFLAGHPQQSYLTLVALGLTVGSQALCSARPSRTLCRGLFTMLAIAALGAGLAGLQLVPTAELATASVRGSGLSYRDAIASSLWPWLVARAILPSYVNDLGSTELLAYVGLAPLTLALLAVAVVDWRRLLPGIALAVVGLLLALGGANPMYQWLYDSVPGFAMFRVPARWLLLYTLGAAMLAALGLDWWLKSDGMGFSRRQRWRLLAILLGGPLLLFLIYLGGARASRELQAAWVVLLTGTLCLLWGCRRPRWRRLALAGLLTLVAGDLWLAGGDLAPRAPAPIEAYAQPRDSTLFVQSRLGDGRFLSIAADAYELKEAADYREWWSDLTEPTINALLVAAKRNEVLTPNLNLLYRLDDIDGYDGGLLPPSRYLTLASLLVPRERLRSDGLLMSRMESLPDRRYLDLFNLRVVLSGRANDYQVGSVDFDRSVRVLLRPGERLIVDRVPRRSFTTVGLIGALDGPEAVDGSQVAELQLDGLDGTSRKVPLAAGSDLGPAHRRSGEAVPQGLEEQRLQAWVNEGDEVEYLSQIALPSVELSRLSLVNNGPSLLSVRGLTLVDNRDGAVTSLVLDDRLERTRFFDMKVYEYPDVLPRAYIADQVVEADDEAAFRLLVSPDFDPRHLAVAEPGADLPLRSESAAEKTVDRLEWTPERQRLSTNSDQPGLLVLSEAYFPGWLVRLDGQQSRLLRIDLGLRGVALPAGRHDVEFSYEPASWRLGVGVSAASGLAAITLLTVGRSRRTGITTGQ